MKNILVTGGAGYIGSHACKALAQAGFQPITLDNLCIGHRRFVRWGPMIEGDIRDTALLCEMMQSHSIAGVIHFAAFAYVGESMTDPEKYYDNNVAGTLSLLRAMRASGVRDIVFSSTCATYGGVDTPYISEDTPTRPINPYGRSKLMCETMLADCAAAYGFRQIALRYFNACGADPDGEIGEDREVETHIIPRAILAAQGDLPDFAIFGSDFPTPDGTAVRDYIHVSDLADAHVQALRHLFDGHEGGVFNLGIGTGFSVKEVVDTVAKVTRRSIVAKYAPRRPGDPAHLVADAGKAREILGFRPQRSGLRTIIDDAWRWAQRQHSRAALPRLKGERA